MADKMFHYAPGPHERCRIGDRELHCGDCFQILLNGQASKFGWQATRIELGGRLRDWWLVGLDYASDYSGLPAKFYD